MSAQAGVGIFVSLCLTYCVTDWTPHLALLTQTKVISNMHLISFLMHACLAGIKISTAKTEIMCLSKHPVQCSFQTMK